VVQQHPDGPRRLTVDFATWLGEEAPHSKDFFENGLIVLDANVLLDLYNIGVEARREVLGTFGNVGSRLWVPDQAALEFSRRRKQVVLDRMSSYKKTKSEVRNAAGGAADVIEAAVNRVRALRERSRTSREWNLAIARLDREGIEARLNGVMNEALAELEALEAEHDLAAKDMQENDVILTEIDELLAGRIGDPYTIDKLRAVVDEAISFRYPNLIPPGYLDSNKTTPLLAAGDVILWRQVMDKAASLTGSDRRVLLITNDRKADWWVLDTQGKPIKVRPELVQELRHSSEANLLLLTLADFIAGAKEYLALTVSEATVDQLRTALPIDLMLENESNSNDTIDLLGLSPYEFEFLIRQLLLSMGYESIDTRRQSDDSVRVDLFMFPVGANDILSGIIVLVEAKRYLRPVGVATVRETYGTLMHVGANKALIVTTSIFTSEARRFAESTPIDLIDGPRLLELLHQYTNIRARIGDVAS
jgi:PIN like domain/Restriction endonuclease